MKKVKKYGLRVKKTGELLKFITVSNDGADFCDSVSYYLDVDGESEWLVDTPENAEYVRNVSTEWYNAGYETPKHSHDFDPDELEVVEVEIITSINKIDVKIPTMEEYLEKKYKESDPRHYEYCMNHLKDGNLMYYSLYDLNEFLRKYKNKEDK